MLLNALKKHLKYIPEDDDLLLVNKKKGFKPFFYLKSW